jgi:preprotein translocase subunit YajC
MSIIFLLALPVLMYFLLIRPQQKRAKEQKELLSAVEEGDEVMTTGGLYGYVNAVEGETIWLEIAENVEIRIAKAAVLKRIPLGTDDDGADADADTAPAAGASSTNGTAPELTDDSTTEESPKGPEAEQR